MKPLVWFSVELDGREIPIILSHPKLTSQLRGCNGVTLGAARGEHLIGIYVNASIPRPEQDYVCFHELVVHGVLWESPWRRSVKSEELFAQAQSSRGMSVLRQLGFKWPRRPAGAVALERWARRQNSHT